MIPLGGFEHTEIDGTNYRFERLDAFKAFHVHRRLVPVFAKVNVSLYELAQRLRDIPDEEGKKRFVVEGMETAMSTAMEVVAHMTDADVDYVLHTCLAVVGVEQAPGKFAPVMRGTKLVFQDLDQRGMIRLTIEVLRANGLLDFFQTGPDDSNTKSG